MGVCYWRRAPRISAAPRSAIMTVGAFVLPDVIVGMIEASTTRRRLIPRTRSSESATASGADVEPPAPALLEQCLGRLSDDQQQCLQFAYVNGRSHQEISQLTGNPLGTVKSWIRRALFALRECLES